MGTFIANRPLSTPAVTLNVLIGEDASIGQHAADVEDREDVSGSPTHAAKR
jgi:hypothetical protein